MEIGALNLTKQKINLKKLERLIIYLSQVLKLKKDISLVLIAKTKMESLNLSYRGIDKATDILTFDYPDSQSSEIFINLNDCQKVKYYQKIFKKVVNKEDVLNNLLIHGCLHLKGYDDKTEKKRQNMIQLGDSLYEKYLKVKE